MKFIITHYKKWLPWLIVIVALVLANNMLNSSDIKRSGKFNKANKTRVVKVAPLVQSTVNPSWQATGLVMPSESINVVAEVSGRVAKINPAANPGALLAKGEWLLDIEQTDYLLNLATQKAQLIQAQASFDLEKGERQLAKEEVSYITEADKASLEMSLVLREPQFKSAQARLAIAKVNVEKAEVALKRTKISMPFRGQIVEKNTGRSSRVGQNSTLFSIVNVDVFWLEVKVPRTFLMLLDQDKMVTLSQEKLWGEGQTRQAKIVSILPELDSRDRQVKLLLAIEDPLNTQATADTKNQPPVFINDFINVELMGQPIDDAWTIKSHWLQPDNVIWVVDRQNTLQKREVSILFKGREFIYVTGDFKPGDKALDEKPGIAAVGMTVRFKGQKRAGNEGRDIQSAGELTPEERELRKKLRKEQRQQQVKGDK